MQHWIAFQLLHALAQCHERGVCHGDIKCENVLVTSWDWVYLADFASYKPVRLLADNPVSAASVALCCALPTELTSLQMCVGANSQMPQGDGRAASPFGIWHFAQTHCTPITVRHDHRCLSIS